MYYADNVNYINRHLYAMLSCELGHCFFSIGHFVLEYIPYISYIVRSFLYE